MRKKDIVLMATISSYEGLSHPSKSDQKQFAELLEPLFHNSTEEARRQAAAALSQCAVLPRTIAFFIGSQPITIAAIFLTRSQALDDQTLINIARLSGADHARAIACRDNLSPEVVDALVGLHHNESARPAGDDIAAEPEVVDIAEELRLDTEHAARMAREEAVRQQLRSLVLRGKAQPTSTAPGALDDMHDALIVRFARNREIGDLSTALASALDASRWLTDRILMDVSGYQLASALAALQMNPVDMTYVLGRLYPHLTQMAGPGQSRATELVRSLDVQECAERVTLWCRADAMTQSPPKHEPLMAPDRENDPRHRLIRVQRPLAVERKPARNVGRVR